MDPRHESRDKINRFFFSFAFMMDLSEYISNLAEKKELCNGERMIFTGWGFEFNWFSFYALNTWRVEFFLSSTQTHRVYLFVLTFDPQQSPPSKLHVQVYVVSSHSPSPIHAGKGQPVDLTAVFFETGAMGTPTKLQNPTNCGWGSSFQSYLTHS